MPRPHNNKKSILSSLTSIFRKPKNEAMNSNNLYAPLPSGNISTSSESTKEGSPPRTETHSNPYRQLSHRNDIYNDQTKDTFSLDKYARNEVLNDLRDAQYNLLEHNKMEAMRDELSNELKEKLETFKQRYNPNETYENNADSIGRLSAHVRDAYLRIATQYSTYPAEVIHVFDKISQLNLDIDPSTLPQVELGDEFQTQKYAIFDLAIEHASHTLACNTHWNKHNNITTQKDSLGNKKLDIAAAPSETSKNHTYDSIMSKDSSKNTTNNKWIKTIQERRNNSPKTSIC